MKMFNQKQIALIVVLLISFAAKAQTEDKVRNTKEKFSTQLKNGTVPGLKFGPVTTQLQPQKADPLDKEPKNTIRDIKNGKGANIKRETVIKPKVIKKKITPPSPPIQ
jgi:hypothetical protein